MLPRLPGVKSCIFTKRIIAFNETFAALGAAGKNTTVVARGNCWSSCTGYLFYILELLCGEAKRHRAHCTLGRQLFSTKQELAVLHISSRDIHLCQLIQCTVLLRESSRRKVIAATGKTSPAYSRIPI
ncbi:hypothetical protein ElyMa_000364300 [Elysia marginata]|uniref:Uncharacterized protein n=1 Tax=Elysia marginata TaxID=1093978 RepID=A0AAV4FGJ0_9GAST|nr:hypothetical protein ElyMa_000364300 [Elysia marginata]